MSSGNSSSFAVILCLVINWFVLSHCRLNTEIKCNNDRDCRKYSCGKRPNCKIQINWKTFKLEGHCIYSRAHNEGRECEDEDDVAGVCNGESLLCQIGTDSPTSNPTTRSPVTAQPTLSIPTTSSTTASPTKKGDTAKPTPSPTRATGLDLKQPKVIEVLDGQTYYLAFSYCDFTVEGLFTTASRCICMYDNKKNEAYDCDIPGPTLKMYAGTTPTLIFKNLFTGSTDKDNNMDGSNIHTHGLHVSSESDDVMVKIAPGDSHVYTHEIPYEHYPGNHWYHSHMHGSTSYHVQSGERGAIIMDYPQDHDKYGYELQEYESTLMIFSEMWVNSECWCDEEEEWKEEENNNNFACDENLYQCHEEHSLCYQYCDFPLEWREESGFRYNTNIFEGEEDSRRYYLVNGQHEPYLTIEQGVYRRLLFLNANTQHYMEWTLEANGCEWNLLGYDGIWFDKMRDLSDKPYNNLFLLPPGGRAEILLKCDKIGQTEIHSSNDATDYGIFDIPKATPHHIFTLNVIEQTTKNAKTKKPDMSKLPDKPAYLSDLTNLNDDEYSNTCQCNADETEACQWEYDKPRINSRLFVDGTESLFTELQLNDVYEFRILSRIHPHHQHVVPFQLQEDIADGFLGMKGDWFDVIGGVGLITMRMNASRFECDVVLHCHILQHEDDGMMQLFRISDMRGTASGCTIDTIPYNEHFREEREEALQLYNEHLLDDEAYLNAQGLTLELPEGISII